MYGAILGDLAGSRYEFIKNTDPDVSIWDDGDFVTDDTILSCALAEALLGSGDFEAKLREYYRMYPEGGYGANFHNWAKQSADAYPSKGNGAAMRVSPVAHACATEKQVKQLAKLVTVPSHNTPEGISAAQTVALMIFSARTGADRVEVLAIAGNRIMAPEPTMAEMREVCDFRELAIPAVMAAVACVREANSFEEAIRNAISTGGDADTIGAIAGSIAGPLYGIDASMIEYARTKLDASMKAVVDDFNQKWPLDLGPL